MGRHQPILGWAKWKGVAPAPIRLEWRLTWPWALYTGLVLFTGIAFISRGASEFIYFNF
jgi:hypothetical protein